jgi:hypothetical protein
MEILQSGAALRDRWWQFGLGWGITGDRHGAGSRSDMKLFLSHNSKDKPTVRHVASYLEKRGYEVWLDEWEMTPGDSLISKISEGVEKEVNGGLIMEVAEEKGLGSKFVIPVLIEACKVPFMLREKLYSNFTNKSFEDACEELVSGIEGKAIKNKLEPYSNAVIKSYDLGQRGDGKFVLIVEMTSNLSPINGLTVEIQTNGFLHALERIGASGDINPTGVIATSFSNTSTNSDNGCFFRKFTGPEIKKGISYFVEFISEQPIVIESLGYTDGYGKKV